MERFLWRLGSRFGSNNNMWLLLIWGLTFFHLVFNLIVFGFGYIPPDIEPEKTSVFVSFKEKTIASWYLRFWNSGFMIFLWAWFSYLSWTLWLFLFIASILSFVFLFDEISRAWGFAVEMVRERREGKIRGPAPIVSTTQTAGQAAPQVPPVEPAGMPFRGTSSRSLVKGLFIWEAFQFIFDLLAGLSLYRR